MSVLLLTLPLAVVLATAQATVGHRLHIAGGHPDLILMALVLWTLFGDQRSALWLAVLAAPIFDALAGLPLGVSILPFMAIVLLAGGSERALFSVRWGWPVVLVFMASLASGVITLAELTILGQDPAWADVVIRVMAPSAVINAALFAMLYLPIELLRERGTLKVR